MASNILGKKVGMTQVYDESGKAIPVTVVEAIPCPIVQIKTEERDGYKAVQLGFGKRKKANRPKSGHFKKAEVEPCRSLREFRVETTDDLSLGSTVDVSDFSVGDFVDITGTSKATATTVP